MTPTERLALIYRPFVVTTHAGSRWGGCIVGDSMATGREGENLLHGQEVAEFAITRDYTIIDGRRYLSLAPTRRSGTLGDHATLGSVGDDRGR